MKFTIFTLLTILAAGSCSAKDKMTAASLEKDLKDFEPLIPKTKIALIAAKHLIFDRQLRKARKFVGTPQSNELFVKIMKSKPFREIVRSLEQEDIEVVAIINAITKALKIPAYPEDFEADDLIEPRSLGTLINEVVAALPKNDIGKLIKQKVKNSPAFRKAYHAATSDDFNKRITNLLNHPVLTPTFAIFKSNGIDFKEIHKAVKTVLSWGK